MPPFKIRKDRCCNPYNQKNHLRKKGLRRPSLALIEKIRGLTEHHLICDICRKKNSATAQTFQPTDDNDYDENIPTRSTTCITMDTCSSNLSISTELPVINHALQLIGNSPIAQKIVTANQNDKLSHKLDKVAQNLKCRLGVKNNEVDKIVYDFTSMISGFIAKFHAPGTTYDSKVQILTLLPKHWSICKMAETMKCTYHLAKVAKDIAGSKGILSKPDKRKGKSIASETKDLVVKFYETDEISSMMPGKKDVVSVKDDSGQRTHHQKRLVLGNLNEIYQQFKKIYPHEKIGISSFANLRPRHCVLAGASGTHTVCVCLFHQNAKLMMLAAKLPSLTANDDRPLTTCEDILMLLICEDFTADCYLGHCDNCPGITNLHEKLLSVFAKNNVTDITYKCWISTPRCTLQANESSTASFVQEFCKRAQVLLPHAFIAKQQSSYLRHKKDNLNDNECIILCDFAENYAFVVQSAASGFHWNNEQATLYPVVVYYKVNEKLEHNSMCIISDCKHHDAVTVFAFSKSIYDFVQSFVPNPRKFTYFTDGAPQQFKNYKNFANIYCHQQDFGVDAEWNFFATAHGKGACDGIGGTIKRLAARASLQLPIDEQILTPIDLYNWARQPNNLPSITIMYWDKSQYELENKFMLKRLTNVKTIPQTLKIHCLIPNGNGEVRTKAYSAAEESRVCKIIQT